MNPEIGRGIAQAQRKAEREHQTGVREFERGEAELAGLTPEQLAQIGAAGEELPPGVRELAGRISEPPGPPPNVLSNLAVPTEFTQGISQMFPETLEERFQATLESHPDLMAMLVSRETLGIAADIAENIQRRRLSEAERTRLDQYELFVAELPFEEQMLASIALTNPKYLDLIMQRETINFQLEIERMNAMTAAQMTPEERLDILIKRQSFVNELMTDVDGLDEDELRSRIAQINEFERAALRLVPDMSAILQAHPDRNLIGRVSGIEVVPIVEPTLEQSELQLLRDLKTMFVGRGAAGELNREMAEGELLQNPTAAAIWSRLTDADKERFWSDVDIRSQAIRTAEGRRTQFTTKAQANAFLQAQSPQVRQLVQGYLAGKFVIEGVVGALSTAVGAVGTTLGDIATAVEVLTEGQPETEARGEELTDQLRREQQERERRRQGGQ
ncbi:MAG: hypothetical protein ACYSW3_25465 [Planctomycetota bacterium]|jgi:hypothetical protein